MAVDKFEAPYGVVFNFDCYTGGFERELCAYVIGAVGDCGVGEEMAELFDQDHPEGTKFCDLREYAVFESDDRGCARPTSIYHDREADEKPYYSTIIFLSAVPTAEEMNIIRQRASLFCHIRPDSQAFQMKIYPLNLRGIKLISNKVERVIKMEKFYEPC